MPNGKTSPWLIIGLIGGWLLTIAIAVSGSISAVKKDVSANIEKAKTEMCERMDARAYPATKGAILETEVKGINKKLDKMDDKLDRLLEKSE